MTSRKFPLRAASQAAYYLLMLLTFSFAVQAQGLSTKSNALHPGTLTTATAPGAFNRSFANAVSSLSTFDASGQLPQFIAHRDYLAADGPSSLAVGDLNGDGIADLVIPNSFATQVSVLLGNPDGTFQPLSLLDCRVGGPFDAVIADFNNDGKNDIAVTTASGVCVFMGNGKGKFGSPAIFPADLTPSHIVAVDLNGDHKMDLAVTNLESNDVSILLGRGNGKFAAAVNLPVGMGPIGIGAGDFNQDGNADLVIANSGADTGDNKGPNANTLAILLGDGKGGFQAPAFIPVENDPIQVLVKDFNKDNKLDLVVSNNGTGDVSELLGNGNGTFQSPRHFHVGTGADGISAADFNGDGNTDLVVTNGSLSNLALLLGDGAGNFKAAQSVTAGRSPVAVLAGDFNHDGKADYITANSDPNTISVVLGQGNGTFFDMGPGVKLKNDTINQTIVADFNGDGIPDLALADSTKNTRLNQVGHTVEILLGKGDGSFTGPKAFTAGTQPNGIAATDFNHDGILDLVVANVGKSPDNTGNVSLLLGKGNGTFQKARNFDAGDFPLDVVVADFNGDGNPDAVAADFGNSLGGAGISLLLGDGKNKFAAPTFLTTFPSATLISNLITGDFNRDGKADIAYVTISDQNRLSVQFGNGDGTFQPPVVVTSAGFTVEFFAAATGDFNGDGIPDFAVELGGEIEIVLNDGNGHFRSAGTFSEKSGSGFTFVPSLVVADFNGDGILDVAAPDGFAETVAVLLGNGDGTLGPATLFAGGLSDSAAAIRFGDALPSIVMATHDARVLTLQNATPLN